MCSRSVYVSYRACDAIARDSLSLSIYISFSIPRHSCAMLSHARVHSRTQAQYAHGTMICLPVLAQVVSRFDVALQSVSIPVSDARCVPSVIAYTSSKMQHNASPRRAGPPLSWARASGMSRRARRRAMARPSAESPRNQRILTHGIPSL